MTEPVPTPVTIPHDVAALLRTPFDPVLSDPARLRIQAALGGLPSAGSMTFTGLGKTLGISDGNLGAHLAVLVEVGYVATTVTWRGRRRTTWYRATEAGRAAFDTQVDALRSVTSASLAPPDGSEATGPARDGAHGRGPTDVTR